MPTAPRTGPITSALPNFRSMANSQKKTSGTCGMGLASMSTNMTKTAHAISQCGKRPSREKLRGICRLGRDGRAGTWNAPSCPWGNSERHSTCTRGGKISFSLITKMKSRSQNPLPANRSRSFGFMRASCWSRARRCRRVWEISSRCATWFSKGISHRRSVTCSRQFRTGIS